MPSRRVVVACSILLVVGLPELLSGAQRSANTVFLYASLTGQPTFDEDVRGGNPFATALVELIDRKPPKSFAAFRTDLITFTRHASEGAQTAEVIGGEHLLELQFLPKPREETWTALVVVFSNYAGSAVGPSLPGAKRDQRRVADALSRAGFVVSPFIDPDREALARALEDFANLSQSADVAVIYTTGHGVELDGVPRILLPYERTNRSNVLTVPELATTARAKRANLIFYAACRNKPKSK
jgi:hypothetical protein